MKTRNALIFSLTASLPYFALGCYFLFQRDKTGLGISIIILGTGLLIVYYSLWNKKNAGNKK